MAKQRTILHALYPVYIRKEDALLVIKKQQHLVAIIMLFTTIILAIIQLLVMPKLIDLYLQKNQLDLVEQLVFNSRFFSFFSIISACGISLYLMFNEQGVQKLGRKLKKYQSNKMILTSEIIADGHIAAMGIMIALVEFLLVSTILAVYNYYLI